MTSFGRCWKSKISPGLQGSANSTTFAMVSGAEVVLSEDDVLWFRFGHRFARAICNIIGHASP